MKKTAKLVATVALMSFALGVAAEAAGLRVNTTKSIPLGIYQLTDSPVRVGEYVIFCPPDTSVFELAQQRGYIDVGRCPGGLGQMMKKVLAAKGDLVSVDGEGVTVNGQRLANSTPLASDPSGRRLPSWRAENLPVGSGDFLLMSDVNAISFDARYFGLIDSQHIQGVVRPILTW
ncbi:conjugative transfer signal peptidase TraF [Pseudomonas sp. PDM20]|uniref:conjugative transfer signal peptidase TraF n=1 Tax=Pseudomonas sp. PDM20 TaxID=2769254 RepID=UPI0017872AEE|nr:conjugative transfer signal peptidase TraF [Pseudomonas sp. PDM20]MBD9686831.1 conjugative transfer signal peptidase TraF [Pseudomonas sp. PDM20]